MVENRLVSLVSRQLTGELTPEEIQELMDWARERKENRDFLDRISNEAAIEKEMEIWHGIDPARAYERWLLEIRHRRIRRVWRIIGWSAAAVLLVGVITTGMLRSNHPVTNVASGVAAIQTQTILPGKNTAILTLANGRQVLLDSVGKGELGVQGNCRVVKSDNGSLAYVPANGGTATITYNTLATPRSGQYQLTLPDGSRVWLNNVSSIRYPTSFPGKERTVELTGEGYFEIAKDSKKPFVVKVENEAIEVLGTSFNVMAYSEEGGAQTTLLSGAVRVKTAKMEVTLQPDEQSQVEMNGLIKVTKDVPSQDIISWKDGFFYFGRASFAAVMRQLARWYDIDVEYGGKAPDVEFEGKIDRSLPLQDLLKFLDKNQIHFRLEGRKLIVLPN